MKNKQIALSAVVSACLSLSGPTFAAPTIIGKRLARTVLIFTERSDQLSRATDRVPGLPASPGYAQ